MMLQQTLFRFPAAFMLLLMCIVAAGGCAAMMPSGSAKVKEEQMLYSQAQQAFEARDYADAASLFQLFLDRFPESEKATWALQRMGESCEGLLAVEYTKPVEEGADEEAVRTSFLDRFGGYDCWDEKGSMLTYNLRHYRAILEDHPDCDIADEAAYRVITWEQDYRGLPEGPQRELEALEAVLEKYPTTSLRHEILYKMAYRCHVLYELYSFSPQVALRNAEKAQQYRRKAVYLYRLSMASGRHSPYAEQAWQGLSMLEEGRRVYVLQ